MTVLTCPYYPESCRIDRDELALESTTLMRLVMRAMRLVMRAMGLVMGAMTLGLVHWDWYTGTCTLGLVHWDMHTGTCTLGLVHWDWYTGSGPPEPHGLVRLASWSGPPSLMDRLASWTV